MNTLQQGRTTNAAQSIVGTGIAEFLESDQEKAGALEYILRQYGDSFDGFDDLALSTVTVIRVTIVSITGKENK